MPSVPWSVACGKRPTAPRSDDAQAGATISGDRALQHEEQLIFELGRADVSGGDLLETGIDERRLGGMQRVGKIANGAGVLANGAQCAAFDKPFWLQMVGTGLTTAFCAHLGSVLTHAQWPAVTSRNAGASCRQRANA